MAQVAKKILLTVPGAGRINTLPGGEFDPGGRKGEPITTEDGEVHYSVEDMPATIAYKAPNLPGVFDALRTMPSGNVNVQDDNGQSWIVTDAFHTSLPKLSGGEISGELQGNAAEKV